MARRTPIVGVVLTVVFAASAAAASIEPMIIDSPPPELIAFRGAALAPEYLTASKTLSGVPAALWWYGCSATSAGMMMGYYDNNGYGNMFSGVITGNIDTPAERNLIASGDHVSDYYSAYGSPGPDPWEASPPEHTWADSTADFMGTNQWKWDYSNVPGPPEGNKDANTDGSTTFWFYSDGSPLYDPHIGALCGQDYGQPDIDGCSGLRLFVESRGYNVAFEDGNYQDYNQYVDAYVTGGFTYDQYKAEIDAGRPVLIHIEGHTMLGWGYNDDTNPDVILYDTWDTVPHSMTWGGSYAGRDHLGVTVLELEVTDGIPEPGTFGLFGLGVVVAGLWIRRRKAA